MAKLTPNALTKEQYLILKNYTKQLDMSKNNYVKELYTKDIQILKPIYESFGYILTSSTCPGCVLHMLKVLNNKYIEYTNGNKSIKSKRGNTTSEN